jgi:formamidopyrimidine-DNA glycosylase
MPELPDLEIIREVLTHKLVGQRLEAAEVVRPIVVRVLDPAASAEGFLQGATLEGLQRHGKFLVFAFGEARFMVINLMLAGELRCCPRQERVRSRDYLLLHFAHGLDLRYHDLRGMGKVYLSPGLAQVPGYAAMGPDALDPELTADAFVRRLRSGRGEVKRLLTSGAVVAGIGNAYADEILFRAGIYPFRQRASLSDAECLALYEAMRAVLIEAIAILRERVGEDIAEEIRDFLQVHLHRGCPCPRCGQVISEISVGGRPTSFCRHCQPGSLFRT